MILYYLDSSAWVKRYYREAGTEWIQELFGETNTMACATLGVVEVMATLARKAKAREIKEGDLDNVPADVESDWARFVQVELTDDIIESAKAQAKDLALRGADAVHLASALSLYGRLNDEHDRLVLVTSDHELQVGARQKNLVVIDPETEQIRSVP